MTRKSTAISIQYGRKSNDGFVRGSFWIRGGGVITSPQKDREKQFFLIYLFLTSRFAAINLKIN
jgi:hypothetical protein